MEENELAATERGIEYPVLDSSVRPKLPQSAPDTADVRCPKRDAEFLQEVEIEGDTCCLMG